MDYYLITMAKPTKTERDKALVKMVKKLGIRETARQLGLAPSTVHELYHKYKDVRLSTGEVLRPRSVLVQ